MTEVAYFVFCKAEVGVVCHDYVVQHVDGQQVAGGFQKLIRTLAEFQVFLDQGVK